ncbi:Bacilysin biosynthesis oxidoreductase YwfH [compost metagenome]
MLPGYTQTQALGESLTEKSTFKKKTPQELLKEIEESIPMGRLAKPSEIANMCVFLGSERAAYVTGQSIAVDGGFIKSV